MNMPVDALDGRRTFGRWLVLSLKLIVVSELTSHDGQDTPGPATTRNPLRVVS